MLAAYAADFSIQSFARSIGLPVMPFLSVKDFSTGLMKLYSKTRFKSELKSLSVDGW